MKWWDSHICDINGVFKGGGAKGVLYAGALEAVGERGHWFRAAAGASAGAITAMLIAAGIAPDSVATHAVDGLSRIRKNYLMDIIGQPLIRTKQLQMWLEDVLVSQLALLGRPHTGGGPVTFNELYLCSGIELYIVCVNVGEQQPLVFHHQMTPTLSVTSAVLASSSIPLAFRPGRLRVSKGGVDQVHRLMDGGVWANYPAFVFREPSFRAFHRLHPLPVESRTVGFTLDSSRVTSESPAVPAAFESNSTLSGGDVGAGLRGWLRFPPLRIYFLTIAPLVLVAEAAWTTSQYGLLVLKDNFRDGDWPGMVVSVAGYVDGFFSSFWPATWAVIAAVALFGAAMLLIGATLIDSAASAFKTLMAVGTDVPYWTGAGEDDYVVRLSVPEGLDTMTFKLPPNAVTTYIQNAKSAAGPQLDAILPKR